MPFSPSQKCLQLPTQYLPMSGKLDLLEPRVLKFLFVEIERKQMWCPGWGKGAQGFLFVAIIYSCSASYLTPLPPPSPCMDKARTLVKLRYRRQDCRAVHTSSEPHPALQQAPVAFSLSAIPLQKQKGRLAVETKKCWLRPKYPPMVLGCLPLWYCADSQSSVATQL